jgi:hypothetical protein
MRYVAMLWDQTPPSEIIVHIELLNRKLARFWRAAHGWAPIEAAGLLSKARLDWQVSLSSSLRNWLRDAPAALSDGDLILAWTNLGALIEGTLKLFLSVYYRDLQADVENLKAAGAFDHKARASKSPDGLTLEPLRKYAAARDLIGTSGDALVKLVQERRNATMPSRTDPLATARSFGMRFAITSPCSAMWTTACPTREAARPLSDPPRIARDNPVYRRSAPIDTGKAASDAAPVASHEQSGDSRD